MDEYLNDNLPMSMELDSDSWEADFLKQLGQEEQDGVEEKDEDEEDKEDEDEEEEMDI